MRLSDGGASYNNNKQGGFMNITVAASFLFVSFAAVMALCGFLMCKGVSGWGWILFVSVLFYGSVSMKNTYTATCPKCGEVFKVEPEGK